jgi:hypothetical protein
VIVFIAKEEVNRKNQFSNLDPGDFSSEDCTPLSTTAARGVSLLLKWRYGVALFIETLLHPQEKREPRQHQ